MDDVDQIYAQNGLAFIPLTDDCMNHRFALPNKLFQAVRAGVPVVAADLPQLREVVRAQGVGTLYTPGDRDSLVRAVQSAIDGHERHLRAVAVAAEQFSWTRDAAVLRQTYRGLLRPGRSMGSAT
ncbi:glycosyltransferase [Euzebya pacifica]|uniref:Glycosyltransferase n=1 Tax=Euzebya pacifica TaxID=1608957 RepID=A0A346XW11_9ACTN|nr:glycosyltransferase [Euzebya pacifica]